MKGMQMEPNNRLLRITDVSQKTTLAKSTIWLKMSQGKFPRPTKISDGINVWKESDIDAWIDAHFNQQLKDDNHG